MTDENVSEKDRRHNRQGQEKGSGADPNAEAGAPGVGPNGPDQNTVDDQGKARAALTAEVARLSALAPADYTLERKPAAKALNIGAGELDKLVRASRGKPAWASAVEGSGIVPAWAKLVTVDDRGAPHPIAANVLVALRHAPPWRGVFALDEFRQTPMIMQQPPWGPSNQPWPGPRPLTDADESRVLVWMQQAGIYCRTEAVRHALAIVTDDNRFHPVRDYLDSLAWDGMSRLDRVLIDYFGAEERPDYTTVVGPKWMLSAVARIYQPGCTAKYALILEGNQDIGKSTGIEILGAPWYTDDIAELGTKDAALQAGNAWIVELAELDSLRKAQASTLKAFISRKVDQFRKPFGRNIVQCPRQSVMIGTINPDGEYFVDETGNVRFWPVNCSRVNFDALRVDRDQLWAEAVARFRAGEKWWPDGNLETQQVAREEQESRQREDAWLVPIEWWLRNGKYQSVTVSGVLSGAVEVPLDKQDRLAMTRAGTVLRKLGWKPRGSQRPRIYYPPEVPSGAD